MILGFHEYWDKKKTQPTYFREKILACVHPNLAAVGTEEYPITYPRTLLINTKPKIHTFRIDQYDRWKPGMSIQMVYRGPKYSIKDHFNKSLPELQKCKSIQKIRIKHYTEGGIHISIDHHIFFYGKILNGRVIPDNDLYNRNIFMLSKNDGFDSNEAFFLYFKKDFSGKIIHWTDYRYESYLVFK